MYVSTAKGASLLNYVAKIRFIGLPEDEVQVSLPVFYPLKLGRILRV